MQNVSAIIAVVLLGLVIRCYQLSTRSLWFDEAFTCRLIEFPFTEMMDRSLHDNNPPLYYILLRAWASVFGDSALALRSLSVLFGALTILGTYLFATEAFGTPPRSADSEASHSARVRGTGLLAATFTAFSAFQIHYSQELRMYSMTVALAVFSSWALFRALRPPSSLRRWLLYGYLSLMLAYTHYYGLFTLAAQAFFIAAFLHIRAGWSLRRLLRDSSAPHVLLVAGMVLMGYVPWLPILLRQRNQVQAVFWSHPTTSWDVALLCYNLFTVRSNFPPPAKPWQLLAAGVCVLVLALLCRKAGPAEWYVLAAALVPLIGCLATSAPVAPRYFIVAHLFLLIGLAVVIWRLPYRLERAILIGALLTIFAGLYLDYWSDLDVAHRPGARGAAAFLDQRRHPGEPVIVCMPFFYFPMLHYTSDRSGYYLYTDGRPMPHYYGTAAMKPGELITTEQLSRLRSRRVWVVEMARGFIGAHWVPAPPDWKEKSRHTFPEVAALGDAFVVEYEIDSGDR